MNIDKHQNPTADPGFTSNRALTLEAVPEESFSVEKENCEGARHRQTGPDPGSLNPPESGHTHVSLPHSRCQEARVHEQIKSFHIQRTFPLTTKFSHQIRSHASWCRVLIRSLRLCVAVSSCHNKPIQAPRTADPAATSVISMRRYFLATPLSSQRLGPRSPELCETCSA